MKREREKEREEKTIRLNVGERYGATLSERTWERKIERENEVMRERERERKL